MAVEKIYLLVHPFYDLMYALHGRALAKDGSRTGYKLRLTKEERYYLGMWARRWERTLRNVSLDPKTQVVIIEDLELDLYPQISKRMDWIKKLAEKLSKKTGNNPLMLIESIAEDAVIYVNDRQSHNKRIAQIRQTLATLLERIAPHSNVKIMAFGEYHSKCVLNQAQKLRDFLKEKGIKSTPEQITHLSTTRSENIRWGTYDLEKDAMQRVKSTYEQYERDREKQKSRKEQIGATKKKTARKRIL